ncbi:sugar ABC transporter permease [Streptosporangium violaceochromogenes]|nr:sugar ABC transporter permease [Streptosporangium violaceochromogenes]
MNKARATTSGRLLTLLAYALVLCTLLPLLWLFSTAFKTRVDAFSMPPKLLFEPTLDNFRSVLEQGDFLANYANSLIVVVATTCFTLLFGITSGYTLARTRSKGARAMGMWIILVRMAPPIGFALPFFLMFRTLNLLDTYPAMVLIYLTVTLPFATWLLAGYFQGIPVEMEEAARIDGCSRIAALFRVVIPSAWPGIATAAIFSFVSSWNEFFYPLIVSGRDTKPASVAIQGFISSAGVNWGELCSAAILVLLPVFAFTLFAQKGLIRGLTHGAVK